MPLIKEYRDGTRIERRRGRFDDWCIYIDNNPPHDRDYFEQLRILGDSYGRDTIYTHFTHIYNETDKNISKYVLDNLIPEICLNYNREDQLRSEILYATIYCTMVAEENKENTRLGKKIKALAVHQILLEEMNVEEACNCTRGLNWRRIEQLCIARNIVR